jgi:hypothetical protein
MKSMKRIIEYKLDDGTPVYMEVEEADTSQGRVSKRPDGVEEATDRFTATVNRIRPAAEVVLNAFREMSAPDEIGLEFGLKFNAKLGVIFAGAGSEANFKVTLKWVNEAD